MAAKTIESPDNKTMLHPKVSLRVGVEQGKIRRGKPWEMNALVF